jgi:hypothetical protein
MTRMAAPTRLDPGRPLLRKPAGRTRTAQRRHRLRLSRRRRPRVRPDGRVDAPLRRDPGRLPRRLSVDDAIWARGRGWALSLGADLVGDYLVAISAQVRRSPTHRLDGEPSTPVSIRGRHALPRPLPDRRPEERKAPQRARDDRPLHDLLTRADELDTTRTDGRAPRMRRGVHKLDLPCKNPNSPGTADVTA